MPQHTISTVPFRVRPLCQKERPLLKTFLYEAIFVPPGVKAPDRNVVKLPELKTYIENFGTRLGDVAFAADQNGQVIAIAWCRVLPQYAWVEAPIPMLALSVLPPFRGQRIGTALLAALLRRLQQSGYAGLALSVQRANPAVRLYERAGFKTLCEQGDEKIMLYKFEGGKR